MVRHYPNRRGLGVGAGEGRKKTCAFETRHRAAGDSGPPDTPIRSRPVVGVRLLSLAATDGRGGRTRASPISSRRDRAEVTSRRQWTWPEYLYPAGGPENAVSAVPVNDPRQSHTHRATPRVVRQPSETVLYRELNEQGLWHTPQALFVELLGRCSATPRDSRAVGSAGGFASARLRLASCPRSASFLVRCAVESSFAGVWGARTKWRGPCPLQPEGPRRPRWRAVAKVRCSRLRGKSWGVAIGTSFDDRTQARQTDTTGSLTKGSP